MTVSLPFLPIPVPVLCGRLPHILPAPLRTASIKYDGACFGKLDTGELVGHKQALGAACAESNDPVE